MYIKRLAEDRLKNLAKGFPAILVTGPRQSGKTTLVKHVFKDYKYISLENIDNRNIAIEDPKGFLRYADFPVILDEVQNVPDLFSYLQQFIDENDTPGQYILTASNNILLLEQISQSLAGRIGITSLLPLSMSEILSIQRYKDLELKELIIKGGYPRIYKHNIEPTEFFSAYLTTYLDRDIRLLRRIGDILQFRKLIGMIAARVGNIINTSELSTLLGITHTTVKDWINTLNLSYIIYFLVPFTKNVTKRIVKSPKLYFIDTGLLSYLLEIVPNKLFESPYYGQLFENLIISDIYKYFLSVNPHVNMYFWKDYKGHEVDLILTYQGKLYALEIKGAYTFHKHFVRHLDYFKGIFPNAKTGVIYAGDLSYSYKGHSIINYRHMYEWIKW